ncbi:ROK family protein [Mucilaginibacter sp. UR6-1]|uniref:ROK family protein n=1 Tax=Mucilaginibacter sp. UR6-1 TaxID=1435643 RepID=UPI001E5D5388|nr:ROK family protein [Mucilaginibacter sp. UR6-1]MCC8408283.1 ROK family protein [Mucilaginibacter sp. UR6-1]
MLHPDLSVLNDNANVIQCLCYHNSLSGTEISNYINKSIPYTVKVINGLIKSGLIEKKGYADSNGGRKPLKYSLVPDTFFIISVAMSQYDIEYAVLNLNNRFVKETVKEKIVIYDMQADELVARIDQFIKGTGIAHDRFLSVGVTMPGFIATERGINLSYLHVDADTTLADKLQQDLGIPVFIENDSTAIALGEQKFGAAVDQNDAMILNLGWGIGLGMIVDNKVFRGHSGLAGEFSHISLVNNGKICKCGKRGCLETDSSLIAITENAVAEMQSGQKSSLKNYDLVDVDAIISEAIRGDMLTVKLISEAAYNIGRGLAMLIHIMNPSIIVLSGKGSVIGKLWLSPIQQAIYEHCIPQLANETELVISNLNVKAQLLGGSVLVIEHLGQPLVNKINALKNKAVTIYDK